MMRGYSVVSLFTGGMGLDLGLRLTGRFELLAALERDPAACRTIEANHAAGQAEGRSFRLYQAAVESLDPARLRSDLGLRAGELDLLAGGPPCGPWSYSGCQRGVRDERGLALWQYLWVLETLRPKCCVVENVMGLTSARLLPTDTKGSVLRRFLADFPAEYRTDVLVADAADYGAAQHRKRVLIVGNRLGRVARLPPPTHGPPGSGRAPYRTLRDALAELHDPTADGARYSARRRAVLDLVPPGGNWRSLPEEVARAAMGRAYHGPGGRPSWFKRLAWDEPAPTLITHPAATMVCRCHPDETRPLTVAESRRVQGFPDGWQFCGSIAAQYRQIGNAVPIPLGEAVGRAVVDLLEPSAGRMKMVTD